VVYLDNASTSFPKPQEVSETIHHYLSSFAASPGRGSYDLSAKAEEMVENTRVRLAKLINAEKANGVVFTGNATHSLNLVIKGVLNQGDHALVCSYSHNSSIRPLDRLRREGTVSYDIFTVDQNGEVDMDHFRSLLQEQTRLVVCNHASNVLGVAANLEPIVDICREKGILLLLDSTQSLGYFPIDVQKTPFDFVAGTGHKTLLGPSGIGFLYVKNPKSIRCLIEGGSGSHTSISPFHPAAMPYKLEAGTANGTGIAGLFGALTYIGKKGFPALRDKAMKTTQEAWNALKELPEATLFGTGDMNRKVPIISFTINDQLPGEIAFKLNAGYGISVRSGIHCAPLTHQKLGTLPTGTVRISFGHCNCSNDVNALMTALQEIIMEEKYGKTCA